VHVSQLTKILAGTGILLFIFLLWTLGSRYHAYVRNLEEIEESQRKTIMRLDAIFSASREQQRTEQEAEQAMKRREAEDQKLQEGKKESLAQVAQTSTIAEAFTFTGVPDDFVEYCDPELGFCFSYPPSWGTVRVSTTFPCEDGNQTPEFSRSFSTRQRDRHYTFGASVFSIVSYQECSVGRGGSYFDGLPSMNLSTADQIILMPNNESIGIWYGLDVGWETNRYDMGFSAPTRHPIAKRIAFTGPSSSAQDLTIEEIYDFLIVAYSYRIIDGGE